MSKAAAKESLTRHPLLAIAITLALLLTLTTQGIAKSCQKVSLPDIENEVMCPVCGTPLSVAESPQAERERVFIRQLIDQCKNKDEIKRSLKTEFGASVLALPEDKGFRATVYLIPIIAFLLTAVLLALAVKRWRRQSSEETAQKPHSKPTPDELARLSKELKDSE